MKIKQLLCVMAILLFAGLSWANPTACPKQNGTCPQMATACPQAQTQGCANCPQAQTQDCATCPMAGKMNCPTPPADCPKAKAAQQPAE